MMSFECHLDLAIWWGCLADLFPPMSWVYSCSWNSLGVIYRLDGGEVPASFVWESFSIFGRTLFLFAYLRVVFLQFGHVVGFFLSNLITWFKLRVVKLRRCCKKEYYKNRVFVGILFLVLCRVWNCYLFHIWTKGCVLFSTNFLEIYFICLCLKLQIHFEQSLIDCGMSTSMGIGKSGRSRVPEIMPCPHKFIWSRTNCPWFGMSYFILFYSYSHWLHS